MDKDPIYPRFFIADSVGILYWRAVSDSEIYYHKNKTTKGRSGARSIAELLRSHKKYNIREIPEAELALLLTL